MGKYAKNKEKDNTINDASTTNNEALYGLSVWFGAIFYYIIKLGKVPFNELYRKEYRLRNTLTGWFLQIVLIALGIFIAWWIIAY